MKKKSLGTCYLHMAVKEEGSERVKQLELSEGEAQLLFETLQNMRNHGVDEDVEEVFS